MIVKLKIKKGDQVVVITGKDKGKKGVVTKALPKLNKILVSGVNLVKRHNKPTKNDKGGVILKESFIDVSNVLLLDPESGSPTKVGFKFLEDGRKIRVAKKSGKELK